MINLKEYCNKQSNDWRQEWEKESINRKNELSKKKFYIIRTEIENGGYSLKLVETEPNQNKNFVIITETEVEKSNENGAWYFRELFNYRKEMEKK